jgi:hypothetical protein
MTTATLTAPLFTAAETFLADRELRFLAKEAELVRDWPERAGKYKFGLDYARKEAALALARNLAADPDADPDAIVAAMNHQPYDRIVSLGSDKDGNEFLVEESQAGRHWTAHPEQLT